MPDWDAIQAAREQTRGRPRTRFITYRSLAEYMGAATTWDYFTDPESGKKVYYHVATVTLRTAGKVRVYAFRRQGTKEAKYILTNPIRNRPPDARTVYRDYNSRWRIEEAHKDLKQHFMIGTCQCHEAWTVSGFIGLVYWAYSVLKYEAFKLHQSPDDCWTCPTWADEFHKTQIYEYMSAMAG